MALEHWDGVEQVIVLVRRLHARKRTLTTPNADDESTSEPHKPTPQRASERQTEEVNSGESRRKALGKNRQRV